MEGTNAGSPMQCDLRLSQRSETVNNFNAHPKNDQLKGCYDDLYAARCSRISVLGAELMGAVQSFQRRCTSSDNLSASIKLSNSAQHFAFS